MEKDKAVLHYSRTCRMTYQIDYPQTSIHWDLIDVQTIPNKAIHFMKVTRRFEYWKILWSNHWDVHLSVVVYFDKRTHACPCIRMVENNKKHLKMIYCCQGTRCAAPISGQNTQHVWHLEVCQSKPAATLSPGSRFTISFYVQLATSSLNCDSIAWWIWAQSINL